MGAPVVHFEINGKDLKALSTYYSLLFGWQVHEAMPTYGLVHAGRRQGHRGRYLRREREPGRDDLRRGRRPPEVPGSGRRAWAARWSCRSLTWAWSPTGCSPTPRDISSASSRRRRPPPSSSASRSRDRPESGLGTTRQPTFSDGRTSRPNSSTARAAGSRSIPG